MFPVALGLLVGIALDRQLALDPRLGVLGCLLSGALVFNRWARQRLGIGLVFAAAACVGGVLHFRAARYLPQSSVERYASDTSRIVRLSGTVVTAPRVLRSDNNPFKYWTYRSERTAFLVDMDSLEGITGAVEVTGRLRVTVNEAVLDLIQGERVELFGRLWALRPLSNPGSFDWAAYYRRQGVVASLQCDQRENIRRLDGDGGTPQHRYAGTSGPIRWLREHVRGLLTDDLTTGTDEDVSLLEAMILGHRSQLDRRLNEVFIRAGCIHFLAVSGIHVVLVLLFARLTGRVLLLRRRSCTWLMIVAVVVYAAIAEPRPPILRATAISLIFCGALLLGRVRACLNWISASAIILVVLDPLTVFDAGFQLSFVAVLGVSYLTPALGAAASKLGRVFARVFLGRSADEEELRRIAAPQETGSRLSRIARWLSRTVPRRLAGWLTVAFGAWLAALPIVACWFLRFPPWGALNSALVFPLVGVVMFLGFIKLIVGFASPMLGSLLAFPLVWADSLLIRVVDSLAQLPGATLTVSAPPWWVIVPYYAVLASFAWLFAPDLGSAQAVAEVVQKPSRASPAVERAAKPRRPGRHRVCAAAMVALGLSVAVWQWPPPPPDRLVVTVLSVGSGSAAVLELPDGRVILYDAGSSGPYNVGASTVVPFLRSRHINRIDRVYLSHPNLDHFSGLPTTIDQISVGPICVNEYFEPLCVERAAGRFFREILEERNHPVETQEASTTEWTIGDVKFERLWPPAPDGLELDANDSSIVLRVSYAGHSILLTGDIERYPQATLAQRGDLTADVLVLPHHGSVRPSSADFIRAVEPEFVIRSSNQRMAETFSGLAELLSASVRTPSQTCPALFNTADVGAVEIVLDRDGLRVSGFREGGS